MKEREIQIQADELLKITVAKQQEQQQIAQTVTQADKGELKYRVGLISDMHFDIEDSHNSEYAQDFINAINYFRSNNVAFLCNAGDICQYNDDDLKAYNNNIKDEIENSLH